MSTEELIHEKHRVENAVQVLRSELQTWRKNFALQTNQELELSVAKILDLCVVSPDDQQLKFKLLFVAAILKRRPSNYKPSSFKRFWLLSDSPLLVGRFVHQSIGVPIELDEGAVRAIATEA